MLQTQKRTGASVNVYLILLKEDCVLLGLRKNTGYLDGMWGFVAGHVEDGEAATQGMIREAGEEIGIRLDPSHLSAVHAMHRKTDRLNVDVFFKCFKWAGEIRNCEPEKCEKVEFFPIHRLPLNTIEYQVEALHAALKEEFYSEKGF